MVIANVNTLVIYNIFLIKHQKNPIAIIFGNRYNANFSELCMENEIPCFILNFGILGFVLYVGVFFAIIIYAIIRSVKNIRNLNTNLLMYLSGCGLCLILATVSGFIFFASSCMVVIITTNILLLNEIRKLSDKF